MYDKAIKDNYKAYRRSLSKAKSTALERLYNLLEALDKKLDERQPKQPYKRPTHDLFCECRKCQPSVTTYHRKLKGL